MPYVQRDADWVIGKAYLHAKRKDTPPASGTAKYNVLLESVDSMQKLWESEPEVEWSSLYELVTLGVTVTATDTFPLPTSVNYLSRSQNEYVLVTNGTNTTTYTIVDPSQLYRYRYENAVAKIGRNLKFSKAFASDSTHLGYEIKVPAITFCNDVEAGDDLVQVDDPLWLAYMVAYEFVRNDNVKRNTRDDLLDMASQVMDKMKEANGGGYDQVPMVAFVHGGEDL